MSFFEWGFFEWILKMLVSEIFAQLGQLDCNSFYEHTTK